MSDWNTSIIEEFRANGGKLGGNFEGAPMLLLHTKGAKTGQERVNPMMYHDLGDGRLAVFASYAGSDSNPAWYYNLSANPDVTAEIGSETRSFRARTAPKAERDSIWNPWKAANPGFAEYEKKTTREIPVVILEPA